MAKKTRHAGLADGLKALLAYRSRPEGNPDPVKSNWKPVAANDNNPEDLDGLHLERRRSIRPTLKEIEAEIENGDVERNEAGQVVRVGNLHFSDGTQTERALRYGLDGKLIEYDAPMPVGAMLYTKDRQERMLGGDTIASNASYTATYDAKHPQPPKRKDAEKRKAEKPAPAQSKAEMRDEIAALPHFPVKTLKPGFPWQPTRLRELFMGLEKGKKGEAGSIAWEDISTHIVEREAWAETMAAITKDKTTLDTAMTAKTMREIGEAHGFTGKRAERIGKKILRASNDNLAVAMKKSAA